MTTPDEARAMLNRARVDGELGLTAEMAARAPFMAEQIASMYYEYAVQIQAEPDGMWHMVTGWQTDPRPVLPEGRELEPDERIIRRLVGEPEVAE